MNAPIVTHLEGFAVGGFHVGSAELGPDGWTVRVRRETHKELTQLEAEMLLIERSAVTIQESDGRKA